MKETSKPSFSNTPAQYANQRGKYRVPLLVTAGLRCGRENILRKGGFNTKILIQ
jgi:hypothetical protein